MAINIEEGRYWDLAWSLVPSCTRCSPGCDNCWALAMEKRFHKGVEGQVTTHPERLNIPLKRKKPTVYAVWNDLFHKDVSDDFIDRVFNTMFQAKQHTYLILTKRPLFMHNYYEACRERGFPVNLWMSKGLNVYNGLTICNQQEADEKIPIFLQVPGKKFLSIEPMLEAVDLTDLPVPNDIRNFTFNALLDQDDDHFYNVHEKIDAVILGGETGPGARPMNPDWVRAIRDQCLAADVPFFFKQWGEWLPESQHLYQYKEIRGIANDTNKKMRRVGRKNAGRMLDGVTHNDLPWNKSNFGRLKR